MYKYNFISLIRHIYTQKIALRYKYTFLNENILNYIHIYN